MIQCVADRAAPARIRDIDPHFQPALLDELVEVEVRHAGFDERKIALVVDLQDAVHALEVHTTLPE